MHVTDYIWVSGDSVEAVLRPKLLTDFQMAGCDLQWFELISCFQSQQHSVL